MKATKRLLLGALAAAMVGGTAQAQAPQPMGNQPQARAVDVRVGTSGELLVPSGGVVQFKPKLKPGRVIKDSIVANANIVEVRPDPTDPKDALQLVGLTAGVTKLILTLDDGSKGEYEVVVQPDYELLRRVIAKAVPTASIEVIPGVGNSIILAGYVNRPEDAETVMQIARASTITSSTSTNTSGNSTGANVGVGPVAPGAAGNGSIGTVNNTSVSSTTTSVGTIVNAIQVGGLQHVQIEVVFASVNRTKLRQRATDFIINGNSGSFASLISGLIQGGQTGFGGLNNGTIGQNANIRFGLVSSQMFFAIQALKSEGLAKLLSEPKIVTQSGRPATLRSGGQQAVLSATGGGLGSISVSLEPVGTTMQVLPIVYGNGKIYLEVAPSNRQVNNGFGIQTSSGFSTGFSEQSVQASVMLESGQTFAIGGLLETTRQANSSRVPVLGEVPYLQTLFSTTSYQEIENELVILVTPRLVDSLDCSQTPKRVPGSETRNPDDYEFYLEGLLETPRGQRQVWNGRCYQAAYKCDPTYGTFPCKGNVCNGGGQNCAAGTCGGTPNALPAVKVTPAPTTPPAVMPAPGAAMAAPTAEPIVMPQVAPTPAAPVVETPVAPVTVDIPVAPGPVAPAEVPAPAPIAPETK